MHTVFMPDAFRVQKRVLDSPELEGVVDTCKLVYGCWELSSDPLQEQQVRLTTETSLQYHKLVVINLNQRSLPRRGSFSS